MAACSLGDYILLGGGLLPDLDETIVDSIEVFALGANGLENV